MALRVSSVSYDVSWIFVTVAVVTLTALICVSMQMVQDLKGVFEKADSQEQRKKDQSEPRTQFMYIDNRQKRPLVVSRSCSSFFEMDPIEKMKKIV